MFWPLVLSFASLGLGLGTYSAMLRRSWRRLQAATDAGAFPVARRELRRLKRAYKHSIRRLNILELTEAWLLVEEERYADARKVLGAMDAFVLDPGRLAFYEAELAICMAHTGEAEQAVDIAYVAAWRAEEANPKLHAYCVGVAGVTLLRAGRFSEAAAELQNALREGDAHPYGQGMRAFHLGEALLALGRIEEAQQAYDRARLAVPGSRWSIHAEQRMQSLLAPSPYR
jgi:tetratricopeptide (TPR) repeat protein